MNKFCSIIEVRRLRVKYLLEMTDLVSAVDQMSGLTKEGVHTSSNYNRLEFSLLYS